MDSRSPTADPVDVVIVIDMINTGIDVVGREWEQLGAFLKQDGGRLAHPTSIAMLTEKGIKIEKNSSTDGIALLASLDNSDSGLRMIGRNAGFYGAADRMQWSLDQLDAYEALRVTRLVQPQTLHGGKALRRESSGPLSSASCDFLGLGGVHQGRTENVSCPPILHDT